METTFLNMENGERSKPHKFVLNLSQTLDLRSSNINMLLLKTYLAITPRKVKDNNTKTINPK